MLESIRFKNYKALRDTTLPLGRFNVLIGPNGSGKSTAIDLIRCLNRWKFKDKLRVLSASERKNTDAFPEVSISFSSPWKGVTSTLKWDDGSVSMSLTGSIERDMPKSAATHVLFKSDVSEAQLVRGKLQTARVFSFDPESIARPQSLLPTIELSENGDTLVIVLDRMRDLSPEAFESVNQEISRWLPEFDRLLFDTPAKSQRTFALRQRLGGHRIDAADLSQGTLIAVAIATLASLPDPPPLVCIEEPDRGIHPRLLRDLQDALFRLAYPEDHGDNRPPVQVIVTTHSPMFLNLFKDHPEDIIVAEKLNGEAKFQRITDMEHSEEIIAGAPLGDLWYTGVLGGVPHHR